MRKSLAWILGAIMLASMAPGISHADDQCATEANKYSYVGPVYDPTNDYDYGTRILRIRSGAQILPTYPTVPESGLVDLGVAGCENKLEKGFVNTNVLTPGAAVLQVIAIDHPGDIDHYPPQGCLKWNGTPPAYPTVCSGTGLVSFRWTHHNANPNENWFGFLSVPITIPAGTTSVTATAYLNADTSHSSTAPQFVKGNYFVKYTKPA